MPAATCRLARQRLHMRSPTAATASTDSLRGHKSTIAVDRVRASSRPRSPCSPRSAWSSRLPMCPCTCGGRGQRRTPPSLARLQSHRILHARHLHRRSRVCLMPLARPHAPHQRRVRCLRRQSLRARPTARPPHRAQCRSRHRRFPRTAPPAPRHSHRRPPPIRSIRLRASSSTRLLQRGANGSAHPSMQGARSPRWRRARCSGSRRRGSLSA